MGTVLTLMLSMLGVCFFFLSLYLGGNNEIKNAVDAGTLNLGKEVFTQQPFKVTLPPVGLQAQFQDVSTGGQIDLGNINALWGKMLLIQANAQDMQDHGVTGSANAHADQMFLAAKEISDDLAKKLNDESLQYPVFESIAGQNSVRMLGGNAKTVALHEADGWTTSLMDRGEVSNLTMNTAALSDAANQALQTKNGRLLGYTPISIGGKTFCFVPFADKQRPHMVSKGEFEANRFENKGLNADWGLPVPNAFSCFGQTVNNHQYGEKARSFVLSNPQKTFKLALPHSFIHIKLEDNTVTWLLNSPTPPLADAFNQLQSDVEIWNVFHGDDDDFSSPNLALEQYNSTYPYRLDLSSRSGSPVSAIFGTLMAQNVPLGKEYMDPIPSLESALFGGVLEAGNVDNMKKVLVQRINQMITDDSVTFTTADLEDLLDDPLTGGWLQLDIQDYYIYSTNGKDIKVAPKAQAIAQAPWLVPMIDHEPDGGSAQLVHLSSDLPLAPGQVIVVPDPFCSPYFPPFGDLHVTIDDTWQPGSGYDGCLGKVTVKHHTDAYLWGIAGPL